MQRVDRLAHGRERQRGRCEHLWTFCLEPPFLEVASLQPSVSPSLRHPRQPLPLPKEVAWETFWDLLASGTKNLLGLFLWGQGELHFLQSSAGARWL